MSGTATPATQRTPRTVLAARFLATLAIAAAAWWAFTPLPAWRPDPLHARIPSSTPTPTEPTHLALDLAAFRTPLWIAPPAPPPPAPSPKPEPPPPLPPLKLQILAIVRDTTGDRALLYDPDTDKPIWVHAGQPVGPRTVERITAHSVDLRDGKLLRTLALRTDKPADTALERAFKSPKGTR